MPLPKHGRLQTIHGIRGREVRFAPRYVALPLGDIWDTDKKDYVKSRDNGAGQHKVSLTMRNGKRKAFYVSRIICDTLVMPITKDHQVDHIDGNPKNNAEINLRPISQHNNTRRSAQMGKRFRNKALSDEAVRDIRNQSDHGQTHQSLAYQYGVSRRTIQKAANRQSYQDVK